MSSIDPACLGPLEVTLVLLRPAGVTKTTFTSAAGEYAFTRLVRRDTTIRVRFSGAPGCEPVRSRTRTIDVSS